MNIPLARILTSYAQMAAARQEATEHARRNGLGRITWLTREECTEWAALTCAVRGPN